MLIQSRSLTFNILLLATLVGVPYVFLWGYLYVDGAIGLQTLGWVSLLLIFNAVLLVLFVHGLVKPLKEVSSVLRHVAEGDFTIEVNNPYHGEIGNMLNDVERSVMANRVMMSDILDNTVNIATSSFNTVAASAKVVFNIEEESNHVSGITQAGTQLSDSISGIAAHASQANDSAQSANTAVSDGSAIIRETLSSMNQLSDTVREGASKVEGLGESSRKIGEITGVINAIAEQTNLLALNAAIEAARAGEQGRGFAVVADEVRSLAERTSAATNEIAGMITTIQSEINEMIQTMQVGVEHAEQGKEAAQRSGEAFDNIHREITTVTQLIGEIANTVKSQEQATQEIAERIQVIDEYAQGNTTHASHAIEIIEKTSTVIGRQLQTLEKFSIPHMALLIAKSDHVMWKKRLTEMLMGRTQMRDGEVADHHSCRFGKWYYGQGMELYNNSTTFKAIEAPHSQIHETAKKVVTAYNAGQMKDAQRLLESLDEPTAQVLELLDKLRNEQGG